MAAEKHVKMIGEDKCGCLGLGPAIHFCPLHAAASMLLALVRAHALSYPHDEYEDRIAAVLKEIEG